MTFGNAEQAPAAHPTIQRPRRCQIDGGKAGVLGGTSKALQSLLQSRLVRLLDLSSRLPARRRSFEARRLVATR